MVLCAFSFYNLKIRLRINIAVLIDAKLTELLFNFDERSDQAELENIFSLLYKDIRSLAGSISNQEYDSITVQPTELVHDLYIKLIDQKKASFNSKKHFFWIASRCIRQLLVDRARKRNTQKRGGEGHLKTLEPEQISNSEHLEELLAVDELVEQLQSLDERAARIVEMKFFGGMSVSQIAEVLEVSEKTVKRDWKKAKLWIYTKIKHEQ